MNRLLYNVFLHTMVAPFLLAYYLPKIVKGGKYQRSLRGKLGRLPQDFSLKGFARPRLWFHAVSVGEVVALGPLVDAVKEFLPFATIVVSTGTETGQDKAHQLISQADAFLYLPLDFPLCVNPVVDRIQPDLFVLMETELWPNLVHSLKRVAASVVLANGRISDRSFPRYRRLRRFFTPVLEGIDLFLMASELDAQRIRDMGAPADRIRTTGNTKFDALPAATDPEVAVQMRELLDLKPSDPVIVAGSTHPGEHEVMLDAYKRLSEVFPGLVLVLVPRHVEKTPAILAAMADRNMEAPFLLSAIDKEEKRNGRKVVVVDRTGELFRIYSLASVVFVGGSLVPKGGQNILEPAAWGKVVLFGPSMEDFRDARDSLVRVAAGREVKGTEDLVFHMLQVLSDPVAAANIGAKGRAAMLSHVGSARRNAELLVERVKRASGATEQFDQDLLNSH